MNTNSLELQDLTPDEAAAIHGRGFGFDLVVSYASYALTAAADAVISFFSK